MDTAPQPFFLERLKLAKKIQEDLQAEYTAATSDDLAMLTIAVIFAALTVRDAIRDHMNHG